MIAWVRYATGAELVGAMQVTAIASWFAGSVWLRRLRDAAEEIAPGSVRRGPVWTWLGWFVPIVQLWFPPQLVNDAWAALARLPGRAPKRRTGWWWLSWLLLLALPGELGPAPAAAGDRLGAAVFVTVAFALWAGVVHGMTAAHDGPPLRSPGPGTRPGDRR